MSGFMKVFSVVFALILVLVLCFGLTWLGIEWRGFFGPKRADVEQKIFKSTRSYNEAKVQELVKHRLEYMRSKDPQDKAAIASAVRHSFAEYDPASLPSDELRDFLKEVNR